MSKVRPECGDATRNSIFVPDDTALYLIRDSVERRKILIHGRLRDNGGRCAIGAFFEDNPQCSLNSDLIDEVATVNDSLGPKATPKERWEKVRSWLRWKLRVLSVQASKK
jgi:hypothetical protein